MFCRQCGAQYPQGKTQCSACQVPLYEEVETGPDPYYLTKFGKTEGFITLIFTSILDWLTGSKMRHKIRRDLGRKATDTDLSSIETWMKVDDAEKGQDGKKRG